MTADVKLLADRIALLEGNHIMLDNPFTRAELLEVYKLALQSREALHAGTQIQHLKASPELDAPPSAMAAQFSREEAAKIVERKAQRIADDPDNGYVEGDTNAFIWTNKEAEWTAIVLEELAEEFRRG